ncbi:MAG: hypothetical protein GC185_03450 [Alphaproteobacteria bacterium]|nr:hypothetical protein [Alphaproteobacteria bacterium]
MRQFFSVAILGAFLLAGFAHQAKADTFVWQDPVHDYTVSFPDTWKIQTDDDVYTRLRIAGPLGEDMPVCRMQVHHDGRLNIYPKRLLDTAVVETLDRNFWDKEVSQFDDAQILDFYSPASLGGKGDATGVQITYNKEMNDDGDTVPMRGVMLASIYDGDRYEMTCSSKAEVYPRWASLFVSIMDSVELKSKYHPFPTGYYRNFLMDPKLVLPSLKPGQRNPYLRPLAMDYGLNK